MADFLLARRDGGSGATEARWAQSKVDVAGIVEGRLTTRDWLMRWSTGPRAPVSTWSEGEVAAVVLGDAVDGAAGPRDAAFVARRVLTTPDPSHWGLDGYFVAMICRGPEAFVVNDVLGLFPVYHGSEPTAFASSIPLPAASNRPDAFGLAGLLAFHGAIGGRTLIPGVRRVAPEHALVFMGGAMRERRIFAWPDEETLAALPLAEQDARLHAAFTAALDAQLPPTGPVGLLLTGGRDSRTLAGRLAHLGRQVVTRTVGEESDHDAVLARRIAEHLHMPHEVRSLPDDAFVRGMETHLACDQLATGASQIWWRGAGPALAELPERSVTGHIFDVIVGCMMRTTGVREYGMAVPWDVARGLERRSGVSDEVLGGLRDEELRRGLSWAEETMRGAFDGHPIQHQWRWVLHHWARFQVGSVLHPISFCTWPLVPVLNRELIDVSARLDSRRFGFRQGQDRMLLRYYPELSTIPHTVENAAPGLALDPTAFQRLRARLGRRHQAPAPVGWHGDRRFVWRNTDFFNPGWAALREQAEPLRALLHEIIDAEVLDAYLPSPGGRLQRVDFSAHQGPKLLVALALWLDRYR